MQQAKDQRRRLGVRLHPEPQAEGAKVIQRLVDHRKRDDRVDDVGVARDGPPDACDHRDRMADGKDADVSCDVLGPVEEEDDPGEEEKVVIARHHMLGAEIDEGDGAEARYLLHIACVAFGDVMGKGRACQKQGGKKGAERSKGWPRHQWTQKRPEGGYHVIGILTDETVGPPAGAGGGSGHPQTRWPSRAIADRAIGDHGFRSKGASQWGMERGPRRCKKSHADMIMVAKIVVAAGHGMGMAVLGMMGAVVCLGHYCFGAVLDGLDGGRSGQR